MDGNDLFLPNIPGSPSFIPDLCPCGRLWKDCPFAGMREGMPLCDDPRYALWAVNLLRHMRFNGDDV